MPARYNLFTEAENEILTRTGPGTPMGNLLRRRLLDAVAKNERGEDLPGLTAKDQRVRSASLIEAKNVPYEHLSKEILLTREGVPVTSI